MRLLFQLIILTILGFSQNINEELKELSSATPEKRVELMNHIKEQLIIMNQQERIETIAKLRAKLQPPSSHQPNHFHQNLNTHQIEPKHIPNYNHHQDIKRYQEHTSNIITNDKEPPNRASPTLTNTRLNHNEETNRMQPIQSNTDHNEQITNRTHPISSNTNTSHNEQIDRTQSILANTNISNREQTDRTQSVSTNTDTYTHQQEEINSLREHFNSERK